MRAGKRDNMNKKKAILVDVSNGLEEMEGARRATGISSSGRTGGLADLSVVPDSEVHEKAVRRRFTNRSLAHVRPSGDPAGTAQSLFRLNRSSESGRIL